MAKFGVTGALRKDHSADLARISKLKGKSLTHLENSISGFIVDLENKTKHTAAELRKRFIATVEVDHNGRIRSIRRS